MCLRFAAKLLFVIVALFTATHAHGQGSNTIYDCNVAHQAACVTNSIAGSATFGPVRNIGQAAHQAYISLGSVSGRVCDPTQAAFFIEMVGNSVNNSAAAVAMPQLAQVSSSTTTIVQSTALYPYVWVTVNFTDPSTFCNYSVYYSGSTQAFAPIANGTFGSTYQAGTASPGTTTLLVNPGTALGFYVYDYTLNLSGAAAVVSISCGRTVTYSLAASQSVVEPPTKIPTVQCLPNNALSLVVTGAGATLNYSIRSSTVQTVQPFLF